MTGGVGTPATDVAVLEYSQFKIPLHFKSAPRATYAMSMAASARVFRTRSGRSLTFPALGLGAAPIGGLFAPVTAAAARATLLAAFESSPAYVDTAPLYGLGESERRVGAAVREHVSNGGAMPLVSTKVGRLLRRCPPSARTASGVFFDVPSREAVYDYSGAGAERSYEMSLERLGLDAVDLLLVHDVDKYTHGDQAGAKLAEFLGERGGLRAMAALRASGAVKAIGAGINDVADALALLRAAPGELDVLLLAGHATLLGQGAVAELLPLCVAQNVAVVLCGPFESGILATGVDAGKAATFKYIAAEPALKTRVAAIERVCMAHGVPLATAALAYPRTHAAITCVLAGARSPAEVNENMAAARAEVQPALWAALLAEGLLQA